MNEFDLITGISENKFNFLANYLPKYFVKAILAGFYVGIASILSIGLGGSLSQIDPNLGRVAFAALFGFAIVQIAFLNGELVTGNSFIASFSLYSKRRSLMEYAWLILVCAIGNGLGIAFLTGLYIKSEGLMNIVYPYITQLAQGKLQTDLWTLFLRSILCNFIVSLAIYFSVKLTDETAKVLTVLLAMMTFVLAGLDHSVANIGTFTMAWLVDGISFNAQVWTHIIVSFIGNLIGGAILLGVPVYYAVHVPKKN